MTTQTNKGWGTAKVGDRVTTQGRQGAGQPVVTGTVDRIERDVTVIKTRGANENKYTRRSTRNVRPLAS